MDILDLVWSRLFGKGSSGGSGTDTSDATLNNGSQMLSDVTAYAKGIKYTGSIVSRSIADVQIHVGATGAGVLSFETGYYDGATKTLDQPNLSASLSIGDVQNHRVFITPSATVGVGYSPRSTRQNGPTRSIQASDLVSGDLTISENGSNIDVTNYATVTVNVSGGGGGTYDGSVVVV